MIILQKRNTVFFDKSGNFKKMYDNYEKVAVCDYEVLTD